MKKELALLPLLAVLAACSDSNDNKSSPNDPASAIAALEESGELPKLDRSSDVVGTDRDGNGVRDDVDEYISKHYSAEENVQAVTQAAAANQNILTVDVTDDVALKQASLRVIRSVGCIYDTFGSNASGKPPAEISREIEAVTYNTEERLRAYLEFNKAMDGKSWSLPEGERCE